MLLLIKGLPFEFAGPTSFGGYHAKQNPCLWEWAIRAGHCHFGLYKCMTDFFLLCFSLNNMLLWLQEYDPDLPPELAAAAGHHDISAHSGHHGRADNRQTDFNSQGRGTANIRAPLVWSDLIWHCLVNLKFCKHLLLLMKISCLMIFGCSCFLFLFPLAIKVCLLVFSILYWLLSMCHLFDIPANWESHTGWKWSWWTPSFYWYKDTTSSWFRCNYRGEFHLLELVVGFTFFVYVNFVADVPLDYSYCD